MFQEKEGFQIVFSAPNCSNILQEINVYQPNFILMDIQMPIVDGLTGIKMIREVNQEIKIVMLTVFEDNDNILKAICAGANGYLLKHSTPEQIIAAIEDVAQGGAPMTPSIASKVIQLLSTKHVVTNKDYGLSKREINILQSIVQGNSYKMIAADLNISIETVKTHIRNVYDKLQVHSKSEAVAKALKEGLV